MVRAKSLVHLALWWSRWDSNSWPPHCESDARQKRKLLPFRKLQPPKKNRGFPVLSHSLLFHILRVLLFLGTYWLLGFGVNPSVETVGNWHTCRSINFLSQSSNSASESASARQSPGELCSMVR